MEHEVADSVRLTIMLVALAALIGIIWFTVSMGNRLKVESYNNLSGIENSMKMCQTQSLGNKEETIMPKAAVYNILAKESSVITKVIYTDSSGNVSNILYDDKNWVSTGYVNKNYTMLYEMVENNLTGKSKVSVSKNIDETFTMHIADIK